MNKQRLLVIIIDTLVVFLAVVVVALRGWQYWQGREEIEIERAAPKQLEEFDVSLDKEMWRTLISPTPEE